MTAERPVTAAEIDRLLHERRVAMAHLMQIEDIDATAALERCDFLTAAIHEARVMAAPEDGPRDEHGAIIREEEVTAEVVAEVHRQHRRYAMSQIKSKRDTMARELDRDRGTKLTGLALVRAEARLASYNDLINCLTNLKGLS